jgi:hypothetical protein
MPVLDAAVAPEALVVGVGEDEVEIPLPGVFPAAMLVSEAGADEDLIAGRQGLRQVIEEPCGVIGGLRGKGATAMGAGDKDAVPAAVEILGPDNVVLIAGLADDEELRAFLPF